MNTLSNMPQQLCSQCGEGNEGLFPPGSEMSMEAQHMVPAAVPLCHPHCSWTPARPPDCRLEGIVSPRCQRPSELCFALFMLTNRLLHFLSHICLLVALLRVFFVCLFSFLCKSESSRTETAVYNSVHTMGKMGKMGLEFRKHLSVCFPQPLA